MKRKGYRIVVRKERNTDTEEWEQIPTGWSVEQKWKKLKEIVKRAMMTKMTTVRQRKLGYKE